MSGPAKLAGFLLLLAAIFGGAYAAGRHLGPVHAGYLHSGGNSMNMGSPEGRLPARQQR